MRTFGALGRTWNFGTRTFGALGRTRTPGARTFGALGALGRQVVGVTGSADVPLDPRSFIFCFFLAVRAEQYTGQRCWFLLGAR